MKKNLVFYSVIWAICIVMFNIIAFVVPSSLCGEWYKSAALWIGYGFTMLSFLGQILIGVKIFSSENADKLFLRLPLIKIAYGVLISSLIFAAVFIAVPVIPAWVAAVVCAVIFAAYIIAYIKGSAAISNVEAVGNEVKTETSFMRDLISESGTLVSYAKSDIAKTAAEKVYEELRYSDPVSSEKLYYIEKDISEAYIIFADKVKNDVDDGVREQADKLIIMIKDRNNKCKLLK